ncbi:MAG: hypothetical protein ACI8S6_004537 [Myxococcota bacterium]|jgi:hypothetical protein
MACLLLSRQWGGENIMTTKEDASVVPCLWLRGSQPAGDHGAHVDEHARTGFADSTAGSHQVSEAPVGVSWMRWDGVCPTTTATNVSASPAVWTPRVKPSKIAIAA